MAEPVWSTPSRYWALFAGLAALSLFLRMLPLSIMPAGLPGPDLLVCLVLAWVLRRPDYMPALLIAAVFLIEDLMLMRPPGLWAAIVLMGSEFLRHRQALTRELGFPAEWGMVSLVLISMLLAERMVLSLAMTAKPALGLSLLQMLLTVMAYPLVVAACHALLRVRKPATGEVDALGRPL